MIKYFHCTADKKCLTSPQASMIVYDITDPQSGGNLGSIVFSESFLESSVYIQQRGKNPFTDCIQSKDPLW